VNGAVNGTSLTLRVECVFTCLTRSGCSISSSRTSCRMSITTIIRSSSSSSSSSSSRCSRSNSSSSCSSISSTSIISSSCCSRKSSSSSSSNRSSICAHFCTITTVLSHE